jgi:SAM-dependent methyltransferase
MNPRAMVRMDITDIQYPKDTFDVIYCSHVLEHVVDDRKAMREFHRVLRPDGWALLLVPITVEKTFEDPSVTDPEERLSVFGQEDHVRCYGPDYVERLRNPDSRFVSFAPMSCCPPQIWKKCVSTEKRQFISVASRSNCEVPFSDILTTQTN